MKKLYVFLVGLLCGVTFAQAQCTISLTANPTSPVCAGTAVHLTASGANTYVWTPGGMTGNSVTVYPTGTTTYLVTGTDLSSNTCSAFVVVTVLPPDNASFNYTPSTLCGSGADALPNITGGATGTFSSSPAGLIFLNNVTGLIDVSACAINTYTITFTTNGVCPAQSTATVTITNSGGAAFSYAGPYCPGGIDPLPTFIPPASSGVFSAPAGLVINPVTGQVDVSLSTPGTYIVVNTIAASGGCAAVSDSNTITINPTPNVTVPVNIVVCNGATVPASNFVSTPWGGTFTWTNSNTSIGLGVTGTGEVPSFVATNSTGSPIVATISVTPTVNGCLGTYNSYTITVSPIVTPTFNMVDTLCFNSPAPTLPITSTNNIHGSWTPAFVNNQAEGIYTFTPNAGECATIYTLHVSIDTGVWVTVPSNITVCNGTVVPSTVFASTPAGATYTWTSSNPSIAMPASGSGNVPSFTATNTGTSPMIATITVTPSISGLCSAPSTYVITVYPTPHMTVPANITACISSPLPVTAFSSNLSGTTFAWTNSNPAIGLTATSGTGNLPAFAATNSGSTPITSTFTVYPTNGTCIGTPVSFTITVNPVQNVTASYSPNPGCLGQNISLSALPSGGTYAWTGPSSYTSTLQNPTLTTPTWSSGTFTVNATYSGYTCTNSVTVLMHPHPTITLAPTNPTICPGSCIALTASAGTGIAYMWQPGSITSSSMTACPATNTAYTVIATNSFGCTSTASTTVFVAPDFTFSVSPNNPTIPAGNAVALNITAAGTYVWSPTGTLSSSVGSTVMALPLVTTTYTVMGTNSAGCTGSTTVTVHVGGDFIEDVSGSTSCHLPYLAILHITDNFVQQNDTILYSLNYGDGSDTTFTMVYQNDPTPMASITHAYMAMGSYSPLAILQHTNGLADTIHTQNLIVASDTCGDISGTVFNDLNSNCLPDVGEFRISNKLIKLYNASHTLVNVQFSDAGGFYHFYAPNGNYTIEIDSLIYSSFGLVCPVGGTYSIAGIPATGKNFGVNCSTGFDLYGNIAAGAFRPGFYTYMYLTIGNLLCTSTTANVKFVLDSRTSLYNSTLTPAGINGDTISWTINHLSVMDTAYRTIQLHVLTSPTAVVNDSLTFKLMVSPISGDVNPLNNNMTKKYRIVGSWDPNAKEVSPAGDITKNTDLTYTIHFQNTGNAEAYNIYILDTLDAHLDLSTLEMVAASHPYSVEILNSTQKDVLKFFFPNIMLPDSGSNQMLSNGFISYKIRPLSNCVEGTIITNLADIYFDYNPAVPTNMVQNQIPLIIGVNDETIISTRDRVIPNPVSQHATLTYAVPEQGKTLIKLFDITGKENITLLNQDLDAGEHRLTFDCKDLKSGIYFIRICTSRSSSVVKLVKL